MQISHFLFTLYSTRDAEPTFLTTVVHHPCPVECCGLSPVFLVTFVSSMNLRVAWNEHDTIFAHVLPPADPFIHPSSANHAWTDTRDQFTVFVRLPSDSLLVCTVSTGKTTNKRCRSSPKDLSTESLMLRHLSSILVVPISSFGNTVLGVGINTMETFSRYFLSLNNRVKDGTTLGKSATHRAFHSRTQHNGYQEPQTIISVDGPNQKVGTVANVKINGMLKIVNVFVDLIDGKGSFDLHNMFLDCCDPLKMARRLITCESIVRFDIFKQTVMNMENEGEMSSNSLSFHTPN
ncbi:hypothetical protein BLNAU_4810 [Blattamonas nauphoetae]|uniref:Uncharacterized protein n=1 Tax=Blattamonas nauphoetae TaxID=2049346 RepID=A0ABQ9Y910_9EUKA|nr:hypothetical protein BLNAU_4810 [Blattamonas nauphoetae]